MPSSVFQDHWRFDIATPNPGARFELQLQSSPVQLWTPLTSDGSIGLRSGRHYLTETQIHADGSYLLPLLTLALLLSPPFQTSSPGSF